MREEEWPQERSTNTKTPRLTKRSSTQIHHYGKAGMTTTDEQRRPFIKMKTKTKTVVATATATTTTRRRRRRNSVRPAKYSLVVLKISGSSGVPAPKRTIRPPLSKATLRERSDTESSFLFHLCLHAMMIPLLGIKLLEIGHDLAKARVISVNE
ncbi:hypothetical protein ALC56_06521 [Trachymyrmex septentrionalis]|uniref:Uncharacterized protein n=1 Tax=Trachymyrmex septentrionalis TaxID=34720 RepID=A0A195FEI9_9HYME|nr:hypothetical protein ALC56_06521 [Trachymyrmex septentrionalis]